MRRSSSSANAAGAAWIALALGSCGAPQRAAPPAPEQVPAGDLAPAVPPTTDNGDRGETGQLARVVLGGRRQRVTDLFFRYVHAVASRDLASVAPLFDATVFNLADASESWTREQIIAQHERLFGIADTTSLLEAIPRMRPTIESAADLRHVGRPLPSGMRADDWLIESPLQVPPTIPLPHRYLVRFIGDSPVIVGALQRGMR
jgi:hypothetical protein